MLRCALLKQYRQLSYEELAFHLEDSASFRAFARLPWPWSPKKSVLQKTIGPIRAETWEAINRTLLSGARQEKLEDGSVVRLDSTVTAAPIHEPSDSSLLWDAVRVIVRLLKAAEVWLGGDGPPLARSSPRAAKKRWRAIEFTRGRPKRVPLYRELIRITRATLAYLRQAAALLGRAADLLVALWQRRQQTALHADVGDGRGLPECALGDRPHREQPVVGAAIGADQTQVARDPEPQAKGVRKGQTLLQQAAHQRVAHPPKVEGQRAHGRRHLGQSASQDQVRVGAARAAASGADGRLDCALQRYPAAGGSVAPGVDGSPGRG